MPITKFSLNPILQAVAAAASEGCMENCEMYTDRKVDYRFLFFASYTHTNSTRHCLRSSLSNQFSRSMAAFWAFSTSLLRFMLAEFEISLQIRGWNGLERGYFYYVKKLNQFRRKFCKFLPILQIFCLLNRLKLARSIIILITITLNSMLSLFLCLPSLHITIVSLFFCYLYGNFIQKKIWLKLNELEREITEKWR